MAFQGINFRANATNAQGGPADAASDTYWASALGDVYPVTRNGLTFGASASFQWDGRDRTNSSEPRLNGIGFPSGTNTFRVDLPNGPGTYDVRVALGDFSAARSGMSLTIKDGAGGTLATVSGSTTAANNFLDATGVERTASAWPGSNATVSLTFTNSYMLLQATAATFVAHVALGQNSAPGVTTQPSNATVTAPATATFSATFSGSPTSYQWQRSTDGGTTWGNVTTGTGGTTASYTTAATSLSGGNANNGDKYRCTATNGSGSVTTNAATLTVQTTPACTTQPSNQSVVAPATATFTAAFSGSPTPTLQWQRSTDGGSTWANVSTGTGGTTTTYTTGATTVSGGSANNGDQYRCVATNAAGTANSNAATLTVSGTPVAPSITVQPADQSVTAPATATFSVTATGTAPLTYQWQRSTDGGSTWGNVTTGTGGTTSSYTTAATSVSGGSANNGDKYRCQVSNSVGSVNSNAVTLTVGSSPVAPSITSQPANQTTPAGGTATFSVNATGTAPLSYQWQRSTDGGTSWNSVTTGTGGTTATYTTAATSVSGGNANNGDQFRCVVTNSAGNATSTAATLTVTASGTYSATSETFALNTGSGPRAQGTAVAYSAFYNVNVGAIGSAAKVEGSGVLDSNGQYTISGLPTAGLWVVFFRFPADGGIAYQVLTAA